MSISVIIIRVVMMMMMMTEMDIETSVYNVHLTRLIAQEDFIKFTRRESTKTYIVNRYGKTTQENSHPLPGLELQIIQPIAPRYTTELFRLLLTG
jgi:hypothetical protein